LIQLGLVDSQTLRFVSGGKMGFSYKEHFLPLSSITTGSNPAVLTKLDKNGKAISDYFFLRREGVNFNYIMDISSEKSYLDRENLYNLFYIKST